MSFFENCKSQSDVETAVEYLLEKLGVAEDYSHLSYGELASQLDNSDNTVRRLSKEAEETNLSKFIRSCLDGNTLKELVYCFHQTEADETDISDYALDGADEWHLAIKLALEERLYYEIYNDLIEAEQLYYKLKD
jgi:hypothetical protein